MSVRKTFLGLSLGLLVGLCCLSSEVQAEVKIIPDLEYANVDGQSLQLDLHMPQGVKNPKLVVWVHGGGWKQGSRKSTKIPWVPEEGYAMASISYRFTDKAIFPAQIHDCKGAVRWLRAHADEYGYQADKILIAGSSAGGMLVALMGTSGDVPELEGDVGGNLDQSSRVQAVIDFFGATDFELRLRTQPEHVNPSDSGVYKLLGGTIGDKLELARQASAVTHISKDDPPLLVLHGTEDKTVPFNQSERIVEVYQEAGLPVEFIPLEGAGHGGDAFASPEVQEQITKFIRKNLP
ncbi:MAG: alpha/beta hydrolase [Planctomycetaceae bacterium]